MYLIKSGFSISDLEQLETEYDFKDYNQLMVEVRNDVKTKQKKERMIRLINQIDFADAVYYGMAATQSKKGYGNFKRWRGGMRFKLNRLFGKKTITVWDKKKRKSIKI